MASKLIDAFSLMEMYHFRKQSRWWAVFFVSFEAVKIQTVFSQQWKVSPQTPSSIVNSIQTTACVNLVLIWYGKVSAQFLRSSRYHSEKICRSICHCQEAKGKYRKVITTLNGLSAKPGAQTVFVKFSAWPMSYSVSDFHFRCAPWLTISFASWIRIISDGECHTVHLLLWHFALFSLSHSWVVLHLAFCFPPVGYYKLSLSEIPTKSQFQSHFPSWSLSHSGVVSLRWWKWTFLLFLLGDFFPSLIKTWGLFVKYKN